MRINPNMASLNIYRQYTKCLTGQSKNLNRISLGLKIASAKDDPKKIGTSECLDIQVRGYQMVCRNVQNTVSMLQTFDGAASNIGDSLVRLKELTVSASEGSKTEEDLNIIQKEIDNLIKGIDDMAKFTEFNGIKLIGDKDKSDNKEKAITLSGINVGEVTEIPYKSLTSESLGLDKINVKNAKVDKNEPGKSISIVDNAIKTVSVARSEYGSLSNRMESVNDILFEFGTKVDGIRGKIIGADIPMEMVELSKNTLLIESQRSLMAQTNRIPQDVLKILENVRSR